MSEQRRREFLVLGFQVYAAVEAENGAKIESLCPELVKALSDFRDNLERMGLSTAEDRVIARAVVGPDAANLRAEVSYLLARDEALSTDVVELSRKVFRLEHRHAVAAKGEAVQDRWRWGLASARFLIGATIGAAIAGPLVAIVPWNHMVGEIVKNAISGASGVLATEIGDPLTKGTGHRHDEQRQKLVDPPSQDDQAEDDG